MGLAVRSLHAAVNVDNTLDPAYPLGNKQVVTPSSLGIDQVAFNAASINLSNRPQNTAISINYRQFLTGSSAATATLHVNSVAGALGNWAISADSLTNAALAAGSGTLVVTADDGAGTVVTFPSQLWSILAVVQQKAFLHLPGIYWIGSNIQGGSNPDSDIDSFSQIIGANGISGRSSNAIGAVVYKRPGQLINPSNVGGTALYDGSWDSTGNSGWAMIDKIKKAIAPKPLMVFFYMSQTTAVSVYPKSLAPSFMSTSAYGSGNPGDLPNGAVYSAAGHGAVFRFWDPAVMAVLADWLVKTGARYNSDPQVILVDPFSEVTGITYSGYTDTKFLNSLTSTNILAAGRAAWPNKMLLMRPTYLQSNSNYPSLLAKLYANKWAMGDFDTCNRTGSRPKDVSGARAFRGINPDTNAADPAFTDYRGKMEYICQTCSDELGPRNNTATLPPAYGSGDIDDIYANGVVTMNAAYWLVLNNAWTGPASNRIGGLSGAAHPDLIDNFNRQIVPRTAYATGYP